MLAVPLAPGNRLGSTCDLAAVCLIGLGGVLGGLFGSTLVAGHASGIEVEQALGVTTGLILLMSLPVLWAGWIVGRHPPIIHTPPEATPRLWGRISSFFSGADVVMRSRYLLGIMGMVGLYVMVSPCWIINLPPRLFIS